MMKRPLLSALMLSGALFLSACESAEEKAEGYYQSALALMAEGDEERAMIELRNVFEFDGFHKDARQLYADTLRDRGEIEQAYRQYLLLIEQYPDTPEVRMTLAELAAGFNDFEEAQRHGRAALELVPDDPRAQAIGVLLDYQEGALNSDRAARAEALAAARAILETAPDNLMARRVLISDTIEFGDPLDAIADLDAILAIDPDALDFHVAKYQILKQAGQVEEAGAQINEMYRLFPDNEDVRGELIVWTNSFGSQAQTEALMRQMAGADTEEPAIHIQLVEFLFQTQGADAALAEIDGLIAANEDSANSPLYRAHRATLMFQTGETTQAITDLRDILEEDGTWIRKSEYQIALAGMLEQTDDIVGARAMIEDVLANDTTNVEALKIRAQWMIREDDPEAALTDLRTALGQDPRNASVLLLMAQAHERAGQTDLAGQRLSRAYEAANAAPYAALLYANFLLGQDETGTALEVLDSSNTAFPGNIEVMAAMGEIYLQLENWASVEDLRQDLIAMQTPQAEALATTLQASLLARQNEVDALLELMEAEIAQSDSPAVGKVIVIRTLIAAGRLEEARAELDQALADYPDNPDLRLTLASFLAAEEDLDGAETLIRGVVTDFPAAEIPSLALYRLLAFQGRQDEAAAVIDALVAANPNAVEALVTQAGILEREGAFDDAIAIYEDLYARFSGDLRIANNFASLLSSYSDDPADLERARAIGRRLGNIDNPAVQDTFGWIAYRLGNYDEALASLEPAATGLPNEPLVHYHLGMTYAALDRRDEAIASLTRALELGEGRTMPQMETARTTLEELQAAQ